MSESNIFIPSIIGIVGENENIIKSTVKSLMYEMNTIPVWVVISPEEKWKRFFADFVPDVFIHTEYKSEIIEKISNRQVELTRKNNKNNENNENNENNKKINTKLGLVLDNCMALMNGDKHIENLMCHHRLYDTTIILTIKIPLYVNPTLEINIDPILKNMIEHIFLIPNKNTFYINTIYKHFASHIFPTLNLFNETLNLLAQTMVITTFLNNKIQYYKPLDLTSIKFIVGCGRYKKFGDLYK